MVQGYPNSFMTEQGFEHRSENPVFRMPLGGDNRHGGSTCRWGSTHGSVPLGATPLRNVTVGLLGEIYQIATILY